MVVGTLMLLGVPLLVYAGTLLFENFCRLRFAENVSLREKPRRESHWQFVETSRGHLIRVGAGKFRGWYLACDDSVNPRENPPTVYTFRFSPGEPGPYVRNLILCERIVDGCYWNIAEMEPGHTIQATNGRYEGWYLDFLAEYVPDTGSDPRTAWNLGLNRNLVEGAYWKLTRTEQGQLVQATADRYSGWYLDHFLEAKVLERNRCRGEAERRDAQEPPLAR